MTNLELITRAERKNLTMLINAIIPVLYPVEPEEEEFEVDPFDEQVEKDLMREKRDEQS